MMRLCATTRCEVQHLVGSEQLRNSERLVPQLTTFNHQLISRLNVSLLYDASEIKRLSPEKVLPVSVVAKASCFKYYPTDFCVET